MRQLFWHCQNGPYPKQSKTDVQNKKINAIELLGPYRFQGRGMWGSVRPTHLWIFRLYFSIPFKIFNWNLVHGMILISYKTISSFRAFPQFFTVLCFFWTFVLSLRNCFWITWCVQERLWKGTCSWKDDLSEARVQEWLMYACVQESIQDLYFYIFLHHQMWTEVMFSLMLLQTDSGETYSTGLMYDSRVSILILAHFSPCKWMGDFQRFIFLSQKINPLFSPRYIYLSPLLA